MRIFADNTAALVIDIQEKLFPHIAGNKELEKNCKILISGLSVLEIPTIITEQYRKGLGATIPEIKNLLQTVEPIDKISFSCAGSDNFLHKLHEFGKRNIIICGIETHVCVLQTTIDIIERGYQPVVIEDCVSSRKLSDKETALKRMVQEGAIISSYESILFELCQAAGTKQFKAISNLVK